MAKDVEFFEPFSDENVALYLEWVFEKQPLTQLWRVESFPGPGIYALYYHGDFPAYQDCTGDKRPIYIGKSEAPGGCTGKVKEKDRRKPKLFNRLRTHEDKLKQVENLEMEDFWVRYLVIDTLWVSGLERFMLQKYQPIWNKHIKGFGSGNQGSKRKGQKVTKWDVVHPGRKWAQTQEPRKETAEEILAKIT